MTKIVNIVGARPQFIKAALLSRRLREQKFEERLVHTGQHYDFNMSEVFFTELGLPEPDYYLGIGSGSHGEQTGKMLIEIEKVLLKERPDMVLVYGDTNSTLAGALAATKLHIPVAHVEAGLRSYNKLMPEEVNRVLADAVASVLFCPTEGAVRNLEKEGFVNTINGGCLISEDCILPAYNGKESFVINVGDVMFDIAHEIKAKLRTGDVLSKYHLQAKDYILVTIHRAENTDNKENLMNIWEALIEIASQGISVLFPVHPRTKKALMAFRIDSKNLPTNLQLVDPVSYSEMIALEENAKVIITDSGGVQKEGYFFHTPCVIPRSETEWVELVECGWNVVTGPNKERITQEVFRLSMDGVCPKWQSFYGNGDAAIKIVNVLRKMGEPG